MEEQQNESPKGGAGKVTAWIGGVTALIVALGGLLTAVKEFRKDDTVAQAKTTTDTSMKPASLAATAPATRPESYIIEGGEGMALKQIAKALTRSEESVKQRAKEDGLKIAKLR